MAIEEKLFIKNGKCRFLFVGFNAPEFKRIKTFLYEKHLTCVTEERDGKGAWEKLELSSFHFIMIDVAPNHNEDVLEKLVESQRFAKTPIFVFSNFPDIYRNSHSGKKIIARYFKKPINLTELETELVSIFKNEHIERNLVGRPQLLEHYTRGCNAYANDRLEEAKEEIRLCLKGDPMFIDGYVKMAEILIEQKEYDTALRVLQKAKEIEPENARTLYFIGLLEARRNNQEAAQDAFGKAIEMEPNNVQMITDIGNVCLEHNWIDEALKFFNSAKTKAPDFLYLYNRIGIALSRASRFEEAEEEYNKALGIDEKDAGVYFNLGMLWLRRNDKKKAAENFNKSLDLDATLTEAKEMLKKL